MSIGGKPHRLAWVNSPEEAQMLKMGGSGRMIKGFPAYDIQPTFEQFADEIDEDAGTNFSALESGALTEAEYEAIRKAGRADDYDEEGKRIKDDSYGARPETFMEALDLADRTKSVIDKDFLASFPDRTYIEGEPIGSLEKDPEGGYEVAYESVGDYLKAMGAPTEGGLLDFLRRKDKTKSKKEVKVKPEKKSLKTVKKVLQRSTVSNLGDDIQWVTKHPFIREKILAEVKPNTGFFLGDKALKEIRVTPEMVRELLKSKNITPEDIKRMATEVREGLPDPKISDKQVKIGVNPSRDAKGKGYTQLNKQNTIPPVLKAIEKTKSKNSKPKGPLHLVPLRKIGKEISLREKAANMTHQQIEEWLGKGKFNQHGLLEGRYLEYWQGEYLEALRKQTPVRRQEGGNIQEPSDADLEHYVSSPTDSEPEPEPEPEPEEGTPMDKYFKRMARGPAREPNKYLMELMNRLRPGRDPEDVKRRLGWEPVSERPPYIPPSSEDDDKSLGGWKNREINEYEGLSKEEQRMKYEDDLQHVNPNYGDEGTGYEASQVTPPWEWAYYNEQPTPEREARPQAPGGTLAKMKKHFESGKMPFLGQSNSNWRIG